MKKRRISKLNYPWYLYSSSSSPLIMQIVLKMKRLIKTPKSYSRRSSFHAIPGDVTSPFGQKKDSVACRIAAFIAAMRRADRLSMNGNVSWAKRRVFERVLEEENLCKSDQEECITMKSSTELGSSEGSTKALEAEAEAEAAQVVEAVSDLTKMALELMCSEITSMDDFFERVTNFGERGESEKLTRETSKSEAVDMVDHFEDEKEDLSFEGVKSSSNIGCKYLRAIHSSPRSPNVVKDAMYRLSGRFIKSPKMTPHLSSVFAPSPSIFSRRPKETPSIDIGSSLNNSLAGGEDNNSSALNAGQSNSSERSFVTYGISHILAILTKQFEKLRYVRSLTVRLNV